MRDFYCQQADRHTLVHPPRRECRHFFSFPRICRRYVGVSQMQSLASAALLLLQGTVHFCSTSAFAVVGHAAVAALRPMGGLPIGHRYCLHGSHRFSASCHWRSTTVSTSHGEQLSELAASVVPVNTTDGHGQQYHQPQHDEWGPSGSIINRNTTGGDTLPVMNHGGNTPCDVPPIVADIRRLSIDTLRVRRRSTENNERAGLAGPRGNFVELFRGSAPYIRAHQGAVMVAHIGGDVLDNPNFLSVMDDFGLLCLLGVRLGGVASGVWMQQAMCYV